MFRLIVGKGECLKITIWHKFKISGTNSYEFIQPKISVIKQTIRRMKIKTINLTAFI